MDRLGRLEEIGFRKIGAWLLGSNGPTCALESAASAASVLYAFVSAREVLYLGKTTQGLRRRLYGYQRPGPTQRTNIAVHAAICRCLDTEQPLDVYVLVDDGSLRRGSFVINLAAGLEDALLRALKPPWA